MCAYISRAQLGVLSLEVPAHREGFASFRSVSPVAGTTISPIKSISSSYGSNSKNAALSSNSFLGVFYCFRTDHANFGSLRAA